METHKESSTTNLRENFVLARTAALQVFDETDNNVEGDIFHELIEGSPHLCLTNRCPEENISAGLSKDERRSYGFGRNEEFSPTRSSTPSMCTDTLSLSSTDHEETEKAVQNQTAVASNSFNIDSEKAKQIVQDALEKKKSGGEEVLEEYQTTKTLKHSTRSQLVNIVVSHMTEIHGISMIQKRELGSSPGASVFSMQQVDKNLKMLLVQTGTVTCHLSCCCCISYLLLQGGRRLRSVQQRLLTDLCISISPAPVLKAISVGGRAISHSYWDQEGSRAGLTTFMLLWTSASSLVLEPAP